MSYLVTGFELSEIRRERVVLRGRVQGVGGKVDEFVELVQSGDGPVLMEVLGFEREGIGTVEGEDGFVIRGSDADGAAVSQVTGDMGVCGDCLREMRVSCNNCGQTFEFDVYSPGCDKCQGKDFRFEPDAPLMLEEIEFEDDG